MTTNKKFVLSLIFAGAIFVSFMYIIVSSIVVSIYGTDVPAFFTLLPVWREFVWSSPIAMLLMLSLFAYCSIYYALDTYKKKLIHMSRLWFYLYKTLGFAFSAYFLYAINSAVGKFIDNLPG